MITRIILDISNQYGNEESLCDLVGIRKEPSKIDYVAIETRDYVVDGYDPESLELDENGVRFYQDEVSFSMEDFNDGTI